MVILLFLVTCYCYRQHLKTKNWLEDQRYFYFARTWYWEHYPERFENERIHFRSFHYLLISLNHLEVSRL